MIGILDRL